MKPTELRIGNLVMFTENSFHYEDDHPEKYAEILELRKKTTWFTQIKLGESYENLKGIPLTAEWLERFGFEKNGKWFERSQNPWIDKIVQRDENIFSLYIEPHCSFRCSAVHELQNLYFALTAQELKILTKTVRP